MEIMVDLELFEKVLRVDFDRLCGGQEQDDIEMLKGCFPGKSKLAITRAALLIASKLVYTVDMLKYTSKTKEGDGYDL